MLHETGQKHHEQKQKGIDRSGGRGIFSQISSQIWGLSTKPKEEQQPISQVINPNTQLQAFPIDSPLEPIPGMDHGIMPHL
jgi:hypothetical protein